MTLAKLCQTVKLTKNIRQLPNGLLGLRGLLHEGYVVSEGYEDYEGYITYGN